MNNTLFESIPYVCGATLATTTALAQSSPDMMTVWIQAGVAGLFALFMLKVIPMLLNHIKDTSERHQATIKHIVAEGHKKDEAWQKLVSDLMLSNENRNGN